MRAAERRYAAALAEITALASGAPGMPEGAQERFLRRVDDDYEAGLVTYDDVIDAYFAFRDATGRPPGFALRWDSLARVSYKDIQKVTRHGSSRPNNDDGTWSGPFPLSPWEPAPPGGTSVVYSLYDATGRRCYIGSSHSLRARLKRHASGGKQFTRWEAIPCETRRAAFKLEDKMIARHRPYLNAGMGGAA
jgi:hypothetical protein